jgi:hypothetical protein
MLGVIGVSIAQRELYCNFNCIHVHGFIPTGAPANLLRDNKFSRLADNGRLRALAGSLIAENKEAVLGGRHRGCCDPAT